MLLILLGISLLLYMIVMNTTWASAIVVCVFLLPISIYLDFTADTTYKEDLLNRRNKCVKKKNKKS